MTDAGDEQEWSDYEIEQCREYRCRVCKRRMDTARELKTHLREEHPKKKFKCPECPYQSDRRTDVKRHSSNKHQMRERRDVSSSRKEDGTRSKKNNVTRRQQGEATEEKEEIRADEKHSVRQPPQGQGVAKRTVDRHAEPPPKVQRMLAYAPRLEDMLGSPCPSLSNPPPTPGNPKSPQQDLVKDGTITPVRIPIEDPKRPGPDPRLFHSITSVGEGEIPSLRAESRKLPATSTHCEWKLERYSRGPIFTTLTETAIHPDGTIFRSVKETVEAPN